MPLTVFGITFNLGGYMTLEVSGKTFNLDGYDFDCTRHNHSTWMRMPLNVFGINIQLC
jgi:hypothetical protein